MCKIINFFRDNSVPKLTSGYSTRKVRSSRSYVFCRIFVLKNVAKFTGKYLHRRLLLTWDLQLFKKRLQHRYFLWIFRVFSRTQLFWKTSWELLLKGLFFEKWWTNIFIMIKRCRCEVGNSFKEHILQWGSVCLRKTFLEKWHWSSR